MPPIRLPLPPRFSQAKILEQVSRTDPSSRRIETPPYAGLGASRAALGGQLPSRYSSWWHSQYDEQIQLSMHTAMTILDVGGGRKPNILPGERPLDCKYIGLDVSEAELDMSPAGSYDEVIAADVTERIPALENTCDLAISYFVLEHVADLARTFENLRSYLVPGGRMVVLFSGAFSVFGLANRILPQSVSDLILRRLLHRPAESVFPAHYNRCWASAIERTLQQWSTANVIPLWYGATYFNFSRLLQSVYIGYEEWARAANYRNLAPYYMVSATR